MITNVRYNNGVPLTEKDAILNSNDFPTVPLWADVNGEAVRVRRVITFEVKPDGESNNARIIPFCPVSTENLMNALANTLQERGHLYPSLADAVNKWMENNSEL